MINEVISLFLPRLPSLCSCTYFLRERDPSHLAADREEKLLPMRLSSRFGSSPVLIPESGRKAVLSTAGSIIRLSSSLGGDPLAQSAGFWIDWDEGSKTGIVLTTAHLIRANKPLAKDYWAKKDRYQYHPGAQVTAHLLDDTTTEGRLLYHQEHYDLAFFKIAMDQSVQVASFADTFNSGQQALRLGRDGNLILRITLGKMMQGDFVYFCEAETRRESARNGPGYTSYASVPKSELHSDDGGEPVIDFDGKVVGMINDCQRGSFVPFFILNRCMELWRNFGCIPRPHLGLQFKAIKFLDPSHVEYIWRKLKIDEGLLVEEVSMGSHAEKVGIRVGDIIGSIDGERISTRIELFISSQMEKGFHPLYHLTKISQIRIRTSHFVVLAIIHVRVYVFKVFICKMEG
ncbi:putative serine protease HhoA [Triticum dicoccoides]|uniref:putative serine protease HhoA n=1 Tax=Triticum dicoccoides TaxID=85692 RepID=UPI00188E0C2B|nr:putative serine protease HhoA [Triticum dicoccoides]